jgi:hypothetical protein
MTITIQRVLTGTTLALLLAAVVHAQGTLTGKWQGETRNGTQLVLDLTATETAVTGTLTRDGESSTISDGKVSKNTFTFKAMVEGQMEGFTGELAGDQIKLWPDRLGPDRAAVLKRVKLAALTGKWQGETRNGMQVVLDLTATETALTGMLTRDGTPSTIRDGKVSKNTFTFKAMLGDQDEGFKGELGGDQLTVTLDRQGPAGAVLLKRVR